MTVYYIETSFFILYLCDCAGVNSGLVVNTTADWDQATQSFTLNSPSTGTSHRSLVYYIELCSTIVSMYSVLLFVTHFHVQRAFIRDTECEDQFVKK